jgi:hypothetical protein
MLVKVSARLLMRRSPGARVLLAVRDVGCRQEVVLTIIVIGIAALGGLLDRHAHGPLDILHFVMVVAIEDLKTDDPAEDQNNKTVIQAAQSPIMDPHLLYSSVGKQ